jgi:hypothetical protein
MSPKVTSTCGNTSVFYYQLHLLIPAKSSLETSIKFSVYRLADALSIFCHLILQRLISISLVYLYNFLKHLILFFLSPLILLSHLDLLLVISASSLILIRVGPILCLIISLLSANLLFLLLVILSKFGAVSIIICCHCCCLSYSF